jgi:osomolarity two-component system, sensor histidine kinase SLN1
MPIHDTTLLPIPVVQTRTRSSQRNRTRRGLSSCWELIKKRIWTVESQSTTTSTGRDTNNDFDKVDEDKFQSTLSHRELADEPEAEVDEVVVDRIWSDDPKSSVSQYHSGQSEESEVDERARASLSLSVEQFDIHAESVKGVLSPFAAVYSLAWPIFKRFFSLHFHDETTEAKYREENWTLNKVPWSCCFSVSPSLLTF